MEYETYETEGAYDDMNAREGSKTKYMEVKAGKPEQEFDKKDSEKSKVETGNQVGSTNIT